MLRSPELALASLGRLEAGHALAVAQSCLQPSFETHWGRQVATALLLRMRAERYS